MNRRALILKIKRILPFLFVLFLCSSKQVEAQESDSTLAWLKVDVNLKQYYLVVDQAFKQAHLLNRGDSLKLAPGYRHITVVWNTINDQSFTIHLKPGENVSRKVYTSFPPNPRSSYYTIINQTNLDITTDPNSSIYIDDKFLGKGNALAFLKPGSHNLYIKHPEYGSLKKRVKVNTYTITNIERYNRDPNPGIELFNFIPAGGYIQNRNFIKTAATYAGLGVGIASLIHLNNKYKNHNNRRLDFEDEYNEASTIVKAVRFRNLVEREIDEMERINKTLPKIGIGVFALYVVTTLDGMRKPRDGYKKTSGFFSKISLKGLQSEGNVYPFLTINYSL